MRSIIASFIKAVIREVSSRRRSRFEAVLLAALILAMVTVLICPRAEGKRGLRLAHGSSHHIRRTSPHPPEAPARRPPAGPPMDINLWDVEDRFTANALTARQYLNRRVRTRLIFVNADRYKKWPALGAIAVRNLFGLALFPKKIVVFILPDAMTPADSLAAAQALENGDEIEVTGTLMARDTREQTGVDAAGGYAGIVTEQQPVYEIKRASFRRTRTAAQIEAEEAPPQPEDAADPSDPPDPAPQESLMDIIRENRSPFGNGPSYGAP